MASDGFPSLSSVPNISPPALLTSDSTNVKSQAVAAVYGLYTSGGGALVLQPDSFLGYEYSNDSRVPQYPQENGAFQSYNKVATPFDVRIQVAKGGSTTDVAAFILTAETLAKSLDLYDMITPEKTYTSVNIVKISHSHKAGHGANMVTVDISLLEIRNSVVAQYSNTDGPATPATASGTSTQTATVKPLTKTASKAASSKLNAGIVQAGPPTQAEAQAALDALTPNFAQSIF